MQFIDEAKIFIQSGDGGAGCMSFRREAHVARGGPDGGDGGKGGSILFEVKEGLNTLIDFRYQQHFKARKGDHGKGKNRAGAAAEDIRIPIPVGTQIWDSEQENLLIDALEPGQKFLMLKGGDGGQGNASFKSATNQAPRKATPGWPGQEQWVWLKLKLLCDVGLAGLPNAGKSTFLSRVTRAKPKIADYPFTTLKPQLGVAAIHDQELVLADIPGLIEGAHEGHGLGHRFLKHIERCRVLLHIIDGTAEDPVANYRTICHELAAYHASLMQKPQIVALNKCDALSANEQEEKIARLQQVCDTTIHPVSAVSGQNIEAVLQACAASVNRM